MTNQQRNREFQLLTVKERSNLTELYRHQTDEAIVSSLESVHQDLFEDGSWSGVITPDESLSIVDKQQSDLLESARGCLEKGVPLSPYLRKRIEKT